jgi:hypothetical protein
VKDLELRLVNRVGTLAQAGRVLGESGVSVEGGGVFVTGGAGVAHFLVTDADAEPATAGLTRSGIDVVAVRDVLVQRLRQDVPGQLGAISAQMAAAGVNIETMYSDHDNQLILVVDDAGPGARVRDAWTAQNTP